MANTYRAHDGSLCLRKRRFPSEPELRWRIDLIRRTSIDFYLPTYTFILLALHLSPYLYTYVPPKPAPLPSDARIREIYARIHRIPCFSSKIELDSVRCVLLPMKINRPFGKGKKFFSHVRLFSRPLPILFFGSCLLLPSLPPTQSPSYSISFPLTRRANFSYTNPITYILW